MNIGKKLLFLGVMVGAFPVALQGMDTATGPNTEAHADIAARCRQSGVLSQNPRPDDQWAESYSNEKMLACIRDGNWQGVAYNILAGSNTQALVSKTLQDSASVIIGTCRFLDEILNERRVNDVDNGRIKTFLKMVAQAADATFFRIDLRGSLSARSNVITPVMALIDQVIQEAEQENNSTSTSASTSTGSATKKAISKISIYKLVIPVFAVGALAVIAYKWWHSRQAKTKNADHETDEEEKNEHI